MPVKLRVDTELNESSLNNVHEQARSVFDGISKDVGESFNKGIVSELDKIGPSFLHLGSIAKSSLGEATTGFASMGGAAESALGGISLGTVAAAASLAGLAVAAVQVGEKLYDLGAQWDAVGDRITATTGKMGADLAAITDSIGRVSTETSVGIGSIGDVSAQLSAALHLTGSDLDDLTLSVTNFNALLAQAGEAPVNILELARVYHQFGVTAQEDVPALNALNAAHEASGVSVNNLISTLRTAGPALNEFHVSFESAVAILAAFERAGIDSATTTQALRIALNTFTREGREPAAALRETVDQIQAYIAAGNEAAARTLAQTTFGARAWQVMFEAIKNGNLDVDSVLDGTTASINEQKKATDDLGEKWSQLGNTLKNELKPVSDWVFGSINEWLGTIIDSATNYLNLSGNFAAIPGAVPGTRITPENLGSVVGAGPVPGVASGGTPLPFTGPGQPGGGTGAAPQTNSFYEQWYPPSGPNATTSSRPSGAQVPYPPGYTGTPVEKAQHDVAQAQAELDAAVASGDQNAITAANNKLTDANIALRNAQTGPGGRPQVAAPPGLGAQPRPGETAEQYGREQSYWGAVDRRQQAEAAVGAATTPEEMVKAENDLARARGEEYQALLRLNDTTQNTNKNLDDLGAALDKDFGISKGLPGIAENLVRFVASLAAAPVLGALGGVREGLGGTGGGSGLIGMAGSLGAFGPQFTPSGSAGGGGGLAGYTRPTLPGMNSIADISAGGNRVAALYAVAESLVGTPYSQALRNDCSGLVSQLVDAAVGLPPGGPRFNTTNEGAALAARGFLPGIGPPGSFQVGWNPAPGNAGHTAATLPGGVNAEQGGANQSFTLGGPVGGYSAQFPMHAYLPMAVPQYQYDDGGWLPPGPSIAINNTGAPEPVGPTAIGPPPPISSGVGIGPPPGPPAPRYGGTGPPPGYGAGIGPGGSGLLGMAESAAISAGALAIDAMAPGAGQAAAIAAQIGIQEINRAIKAAGQFAGIGIGGVMETLLPAGASELANRNWITRLAGGLLGAGPQLPNTAGQKTQQQQQQQLTADQVRAAAPPMPPPGVHTGSGQPPGPVNNFSVTVNNTRPTGDGIDRDITWHLGQMAGQAFFAGKR